MALSGAQASGAEAVLERSGWSPGEAARAPAGARLRDVVAQPVDRITLTLALAIIGLNLVDAFATLRHLSHGAEELNPLMDSLLQLGAGPFLVVKHALASLGVLGIVLHRELFAARVALRLLLPIYAALALYQIALFAFIP